MAKQMFPVPILLTTTFLITLSALHAEDLPAHGHRKAFQPVICEELYPHHLQGVCTDRANAIFWSFTTKLVKTDRSGKVLNTVDVANHHGDLCFHESKIYVAVNLGKFNDPKGNADSWVYVYNFDDLSCVARHKTAEVFYGAGGVACHERTFLVVGGLPDDVNENYVYQYDDEFKFVAKHALPGGHTHLGIQTATFANGSWWFGCYGRPKSTTGPSTPPILLKADASLTKVERFEFDCSLGILPAGDDTFLVARGNLTKDRRNSGLLVRAVPDAINGLKLIEK